MSQLAIDFTAARAEGSRMADLALDKAEKQGFDTEGAGKFVLGWLARHGQQSGEQLVDAAMQHGFRPKEARAFGAVFSTLSRRGQIRCVGFCMREKGHGTAGVATRRTRYPGLCLARELHGSRGRAQRPARRRRA